MRCAFFRSEDRCDSRMPRDQTNLVSTRPGLHYGQSSLVAEMVKNLPAMQETQVRSLDQEDPLEKGIANNSSILPWTIPWTEESGGLLRGVTKSHKYTVMV